MSGGRFRLLTFNTLFRPAARARLRAIAPIINGSGIEIVCLQEVIYRANASLLKRALTLYEPRPRTDSASGAWAAWSRFRGCRSGKRHMGFSNDEGNGARTVLPTDCCARVF